VQKLNFHKLRALHDVADKHEDSEMADFIGVHADLLNGSSAVISFHIRVCGFPRAVRLATFA